MVFGPLNSPPHPDELALGSRVAAAMWLTAGTLLALLVAWSLEPHWVA